MKYIIALVAACATAQEMTDAEYEAACNNGELLGCNSNTWTPIPDSNTSEMTEEEYNEACNNGEILGCSPDTWTPIPDPGIGGEEDTWTPTTDETEERGGLITRNDEGRW